MHYKEIYRTKDWDRAYLFYGPEKLLIEYCLGYLAERLVPDKTESFNLTILQGKDAKIGDVISACERVPLMSEKKLVVLRDVATFVDNQKIDDSFLQFLDNLPSFNVLVFEETQNLAKTTKLYKYFLKKKRNVEFAPLLPRDFQKFVESAFLRKGKRLSAQDLSFFVIKSNYSSKNTDVSLMDVKNEIDKISATVSGEQVTRADILASLSESIDTNIFAFLDGMYQGNTDVALREFMNLYRLNEPIPKIFVMIHRQVRLLLQYKMLREGHYQPVEMMEEMGVKKFEFSKIQNYEGRFSKEFLLHFYDTLIQSDEIFKSTNIDPVMEMEGLIVKYCRLSQ